MSHPAGILHEVLEVDRRRHSVPSSSSSSSSSSTPTPDSAAATTTTSSNESGGDSFSAKLLEDELQRFLLPAAAPPVDSRSTTVHQQQSGDGEVANDDSLPVDVPGEELRQNLLMPVARSQESAEMHQSVEETEVIVSSPSNSLDEELRNFLFATTLSQQNDDIHHSTGVMEPVSSNSPVCAVNVAAPFDLLDSDTSGLLSDALATQQTDGINQTRSVVIFAENDQHGDVSSPILNRPSESPFPVETSTFASPQPCDDSPAPSSQEQRSMIGFADAEVGDSACSGDALFRDDEMNNPVSSEVAVVECTTSSLQQQQSVSPPSSPQKWHRYYPNVRGIEVKDHDKHETLLCCTSALDHSSRSNWIGRGESLESSGSEKSDLTKVDVDSAFNIATPKTASAGSSEFQPAAVENRSPFPAKVHAICESLSSEGCRTSTALMELEMLLQDVFPTLDYPDSHNQGILEDYSPVANDGKVESAAEANDVDDDILVCCLPPSLYRTSLPSFSAKYSSNISLVEFTYTFWKNVPLNIRGDVKYGAFLQAFCDDDFIISIALSHIVCKFELDRIARQLFLVMEKTQQFFKFTVAMIDFEVNTADTGANLFHGNVFFHKFLNLLFHQTSYTDFLRPVISEMINKQNSFMTLSGKIAAKDQAKRNTDYVVASTELFIDQIISALSSGSFPMHLHYVLYQMAHAVEKRFPKFALSTVGMILFVRILGPILIGPERYGLIKDGNVSAEARRGLVFIVKVLQKIFSKKDTYHDADVTTSNLPLKALNRKATVLYDKLANKSVESFDSQSFVRDSFVQTNTDGLVESIEDKQSLNKLHLYMRQNRSQLVLNVSDYFNRMQKGSDTCDEEINHKKNCLLRNLSQLLDSSVHPLQSYVLKVFGTSHYLLINGKESHLEIKKWPYVQLCLRTGEVPTFEFVDLAFHDQESLISSQIARISGQDMSWKFDDEEVFNFRFRLYQNITNVDRSWPAVHASYSSTPLPPHIPKDFLVTVYFPSTSRARSKTLRCSIEMTTLELMTEVCQKMKRHVDVEANQMVFKAVSQEMYLFDNVPLKYVSHVRERLLLGKRVVFSAVPLSSVVREMETGDFFDESKLHSTQEPLDSLASLTISPLVVSSFAVNSPFKICINEVCLDDAKSFFSSTGHVEAGLYFGGVLLAPTVRTKSKQCSGSGKFIFNFWFSFPLNISSIPNETRVCFDVCFTEMRKRGVSVAKTSSASQLKPKAVSLAPNPILGRSAEKAESPPQMHRGVTQFWTSCRAFDHRARLVGGSCFYPLLHGKSNPIGICVENMNIGSSSGMNLNVSFPGSTTIVYPSALPDPAEDEDAVSSRLPQEDARKTLISLIQRDTLHTPNAEESRLLWTYRGFCRKKPQSLSKLLLSVPYIQPEAVCEVSRMLPKWGLMDPVTAMELLDWKYANTFVRAYAVKCMHQLSDAELADYMMQLVQAVKFEPYHDSPLAIFLLQRALENRVDVGHSFCWFLKSEIHIPEVKQRLGILMESYLRFVASLLIRNIFLYLDRTFVFQHGQPPLWEVGLSLFSKHIVQNSEVSQKMISGVLSMIRKDRNNESVNRVLLSSVLKLYSAIGLYRDHFENSFLLMSKSYFQEEGVRFISQSDVSDYLRHVEDRIAEENERVFEYLDSSSRVPLIRILEKTLITNHVETILQKGFHNLMDLTKIPDLSRIYSLFSRIMGLHELKKAFSSYIMSEGKKIVMNEKGDKTMIQSLLAFKDRVDCILHQGFHDNPGFGNSLKQAFEDFINQRKNRPAELIAKFLDQKLRIGNKGITEEELEVLLDRVLVLFRYIEGKDVFEAFFKRDLAKRLLLGKSASVDLERSMVAKLKSECGSNFYGKLEGMFKDMDLSKDLMASFGDSTRRIGDIDLNVNVLTSSFWPAYNPVEINLPRELADLQQRFSAFYLSKYSGRKIRFEHALGSCTLSASFRQAVCLLLLNDVESLSYKDIEEATGLDPKELKITLQSLACGKVRVLLKQPKSRDVSDSDSFVFDYEFTNPAFRIKINAIQMVETPEENSKTSDGVMHDRQYQIDAAVVRIMKSRKTYSHSELSSEVYMQVKFPFTATDLKKRIESLIDREYIERDSDNPQMYMYLA